MLAADQIVLRLGGEVYPLRASLRAAIRLDRNHGLPALAKGIADGSLSILSAILAECGAPANVFAGRALGEALPDACAACAQLLPEVFGLSDRDDRDDAPPQAGKSITHAEHLGQLYRAATGTLGWPPSQTLDATPAEIIEAATGRHAFVGDILRAVFGAPDTGTGDDPETSAPAHTGERSYSSKAFLDAADAERDVSGIAQLRNMARAA